jgi:hypothetical protein
LEEQETDLDKKVEAVKAEVRALEENEHQLPHELGYVQGASRNREL